MKELLNEIIALLEIPRSYYDRAEARYHSLGEWFHRSDSSIRDFEPDVYPQGSFRYGTVIRPLFDDEEYDLDLVCQLAIEKSSLAQVGLKNLVGDEVKSYASGNDLKEQATEKRRCWRLDYQDEVKFHMDILPAIPDDEEFKALLVANNVDVNHADQAISITDVDHANYTTKSGVWPKSNPRGFAGWFESRMIKVARNRRRELVANQAYSSVDEVPPYEWKTPLQQSIQILKRHRDVMFKTNPDKKPISMIITTLAAHAYNGEQEIDVALKKIVDRMPLFVSDSTPRVCNPVDPAEDFADKWIKDVELEENFWNWHAQVKIDLGNLGGPSTESEHKTLVQRSLGLKLPSSLLASLASSAAGAASGGQAAIKAPTVIESAPKPWDSDA